MSFELNHNPGNIRPLHDGIWVGQTGVDSHGFVVFDTIEHGMRALMRNLLSYYNNRGLKTVERIIERWAPPDDGNDTDAYIANVAKWLGVKPDDPLTMTDEVTLSNFAAAIAHQEQGGVALTLGPIVYASAYQMAIAA